MFSTNPTLARLGHPQDARLVIFHVDDAGMCHGSNRAYLDLLAAGLVKTGSIMTPCPWSHELLAVCAGRPELDIGVHLTLNSEWPGYRWGPVSTRAPESGLVDERGCFWPLVADTAAHLNAPAALAELRAQIEIVRAAGVQFTHLDNHMGATLLPELFYAYVELGFEYGVPVFLARELDDYTRGFGVPGMDNDTWSRYTASLEARGMPLLDTFRITPGYHIDDREGGRVALYERILHDLPAGVTYFSLHPNAPGDIEAIDPPHAHWRTLEYEYFGSERLAAFLQSEGIVPIGYAELREAMRRA